MSPTVICATSGGANNSSQQAVFAYVFSLMICSAICVDECSVYATVYLVMQVYMSDCMHLTLVQLIQYMHDTLCIYV